jgi:hypothetical protein
MESFSFIPSHLCQRESKGQGLTGVTIRLVCLGVYKTEEQITEAFSVLDSACFHQIKTK